MEIRVERIANGNSVREEGWRGIVSTASTSVSKTESPGSNPGAPATKDSAGFSDFWQALCGTLMTRSLGGYIV